MTGDPKEAGDMATIAPHARPELMEKTAATVHCRRSRTHDGSTRNEPALGWRRPGFCSRSGFPFSAGVPGAHIRGPARYHGAGFVFRPLPNPRLMEEVTACLRSAGPRAGRVRGTTRALSGHSHVVSTGAPGVHS